ncbi:MAG: hypothetical protein L3J46_11790 [Kangiellaceae bacterium]|nr:hypothetical protein [Kangiellaceae bacterium]
MMQIDNSFAPKELLVPQDFVLKMSDFSFLDATVLRRITLDYLCYHDTEE